MRSVGDPRWERRLLDYAHLCAREGLSPSFLEKLADMLQEDWPVVLAILQYDARGRLAPRHVIRQVSGSQWKAYAEHFGAINPFPRVVSEQHLENRTARLTRFTAADDLLRSEYYNDFMRPLGRFLLALSIEVPEIGRTSITFYRKAEAGGDFGAEEVRRLESLRPFLRAALLLRMLACTDAHVTGLGDAVESLAPPALMVRPGLAPRPVNSGGEKLLRRIRRSPESLRSAIQIPIEDITGRVVDPTRSAGTVVTFAPCPAPAAGLRESLRRRFGLTEMQAVVAVALLDGLRYKEIADEFGISRHTVHAHVKSVLAKAGVGSARQLAAAVTALP